MGQNQEKDRVFLGKPVIGIPDEWENPVIGFCTDYEKDVPVIFNYITNHEEVVEYKVFDFNEQRFQLVLKIDPFELASFVYAEDCGEEIYRRQKKVFILKPEQVLEALRKNGFWERLKQYRMARLTQKR